SQITLTEFTGCRTGSRLFTAARRERPLPAQPAQRAINRRRIRDRESAHSDAQSVEPRLFGSPGESVLQQSDRRNQSDTRSRLGKPDKPSATGRRELGAKSQY